MSRSSRCLLQAVYYDDYASVSHTCLWSARPIWTISSANQDLKTAAPKDRHHTNTWLESLITGPGRPIKIKHPGSEEGHCSERDDITIITRIAWIEKAYVMVLNGRSSPKIKDPKKMLAPKRRQYGHTAIEKWYMFWTADNMQTIKIWKPRLGKNTIIIIG